MAKNVGLSKEQEELCELIIGEFDLPQEHEDSLLAAPQLIHESKDHNSHLWTYNWRKIYLQATHDSPAIKLHVSLRCYESAIEKIGKGEEPQNGDVLIEFNPFTLDMSCGFDPYHHNLFVRVFKAAYDYRVEKKRKEAEALAKAQNAALDVLRHIQGKATTTKDPVGRKITVA